MTSVNTNYPSLDIDLYLPDVVANPWPTLKKIREAGSLVWNERGYWMAARNRICREIFSRSDVFGVKPVTAAFFGEEAFIAIDDVQTHNALRNVWAADFRRDSLKSLSETIRTIAAELLKPAAERLKSGESVDLTPTFCRVLPAYVIAHMLGVPSDMRSEVVRWSDLMAASTAAGYDIDVEDTAWIAGEQAKRELADFLYEQIRYRRKTAGDDLISQIVHSDVGATLSEEAIMKNTRQLLFAGNETTANWLGHIAVILGSRPDVRAELHRERPLLAGAVEEMMRWETVVQALPRTVHGGDTMIGDVLLTEGSPVVMLTGGANRDPDRFVEPDELNIRRDAGGTLSFGFRLHNCLGIALARLEAAESTDVLLDLLPEYEVSGPVTYTGFNLRGPATIPVTAV